MKRFLRAGGVAAACLAASGAFGQILDLDPGVGWVTRGGVGTGRSVYITANEDFDITGAGFMCDMPADRYEVIIFEGAGEFVLPGPILASTTVSLGGIGENWQDADLSYSFTAGADYILHFRSATPGAAVATSYQRGASWWGDGPGEDLNIGVLTLRDGREGYDAQNWSNLAFPRMRLLGVSAGGCVGDLDGDGDTDLADLGILLADFGCAAPGPCAGDLDGDGDTDLADLGILLADFGCAP